jgi:dTMP kinase
MAMFIAFEGLDRAGKTTQCARLVSELEKMEQRVMACAFPDRDGQLYPMIGAYLKGEAKVEPRAMHLLFAADRWAKDGAIRKALRDGVVVTDRYRMSGAAYSVAMGLDEEWCRRADDELCPPTLTIYISISPETASRRAGFGEDIHDNLAFQRKVHAAYMNLMAHESNVVVIDGNDTEEKVHASVMKAVRGAMGLE